MKRAARIHRPPASRWRDFCVPASAITTACGVSFKLYFVADEPVAAAEAMWHDRARQVSPQGEDVKRTRLVGAALSAFILAAPAAIAAAGPPASGGTLASGIKAGEPPAPDLSQ